MKNFELIIYLSLALLFQGCYSATIMQTAKPLEKGQSEITIGLTVYEDYSSLYGVSPDFMWRRGIGKRSDIGIAYSFGLDGHLKLDYKYVLCKSTNENVFLSSGIGFDAILMNEFVGSYDVAIKLPVYFSFNHNKNVVPYFSQNITMGLGSIGIIKHYQEDVVNQRYNYNHAFYWSGGLGIRWGQNRIKGYFELTHAIRYSHQYRSWVDTNNPEEWILDRNANTDYLLQASIGMTFNLKKSKKNRTK